MTDGENVDRHEGHGVIRDRRDAGAIPDLLTDGRCVTRTLANSDLSEEALEKIRLQAAALLGDVVSAYEREVGQGEVGADGTGVVGERPQPEGYGPTGLLYGRIQSGKTLAMIAFTAMAIDNGFRVVVVLTSNFVELVKQTAHRFGLVARALVHASTDRKLWVADTEIIAKHAGRRGLVVVCAKESRHLESVRELLERIDAAGLPAVILDDEADQASPDANARKRSTSSTPEDVPEAKIHSQIASIRRAIPSHVFLQVTATPYCLLLQNVNNPLRPRFTRLLEPGAGYTGGEDFFSNEHIGADAGHSTRPPIVVVDENESDRLESGVDSAPVGLERAVTLFLVAAAQQVLDDPSVLSQSQNFLCHTSHKMVEHARLEELIRSFLDHLEDGLENAEVSELRLVEWARRDLMKTLPEIAPVEDLVEEILESLPRRRIRVINASGGGGEELPGAPNFIIGGNIVGRGLTIPNLLVTYYLRKPKVSQMDTMLQHARMFGYRRDLMPYTRVFLPWSLAVRFNGIHRAEHELRSFLEKHSAAETVPVQVVGDLRATRYGVLDTGSVSSLRSGQHVFPTTPPYDLSRSKRRRVDEIAASVFGEDFESHEEIDGVLARAELVGDLCESFESPDWNGPALSTILKANARDGKVWLRYRRMRRERRAGQGPELLTGALGGDELKEARSRPVPSFFLFKQVLEQDVWDRRLFWYPTIVFPNTMPTQVYNESSELD